MLIALHYFFMVFHSFLVIFNLVGWVVPATRKLNLFTLTITALSWTVLGIWYGFGYCPLTDFHYRILEKLGYTGLPNSYIKFLIDSIFNTNVNAELVDFLTVSLFVFSLICSVFLNLLPFRKSRQ